MASISFCGECNNLLYPKEDKVSHVLMYACRNCHYKEETTNPCVYKHDLETAGVTQDLQTDPTLTASPTTAKIKYRMSKMGNTPQDDDPVRSADSSLLAIDAMTITSDLSRHLSNSQHKEAVFFQGQAKRTDTKMTLFFVCTNCHKTFQDPILNRR
ncbi:BZ3500_MvSof-1268-A1-R1_Chr8-2g10114 [Microbotryum saponariae]|uniref:DNA-directed RNA polymerase subunit n=1 Tax=Microbotryum saponariae TaxID=289078 RepID=A0A2X0KVA2_9BASI|nr:BZ3500_MvSof-1268-A1-R1_Chr8-2g10114 [Microbotryum saponariae]SDA01812.1 BZ3501_MvSof-1269-A2-R1_Chr8-2g09865 [Microbotryum saponariae]